MDIMELGAIGELVGGVAVIATFVYLAMEVRQNTNALTSAAEVAGGQQVLSVYSPVVENSDLADIILRGGASFETLDPPEQLRFALLWRGALIAHQGFFF